MLTEETFSINAIEVRRILFVQEKEKKKKEAGTQTVKKHAISFVSWFSSYLLDFIMSYVQYHQGRSQLYHFAILMIPCNMNHVSYWEDIKSFPYSIPIHDSYIPCYALLKSLNILCPFLLVYSECVKTSIKVTKNFNSCPNPRIEWKYVECIYEIIKG